MAGGKTRRISIRRSATPGARCRSACEAFPTPRSCGLERGGKIGATRVTLRPAACRTARSPLTLNISERSGGLAEERPAARDRRPALLRPEPFEGCGTEAFLALARTFSSENGLAQRAEMRGFRAPSSEGRAPSRRPTAHQRDHQDHGWTGRRGIKRQHGHGRAGGSLDDCGGGSLPISRIRRSSRNPLPRRAFFAADCGWWAIDGSAFLDLVRHVPHLGQDPVAATRTEAGGFRQPAATAARIPSSASFTSWAVTIDAETPFSSNAKLGRRPYVRPALPRPPARAAPEPRPRRANELGAR